MCCFSGSVRQVAGTRIFARPLEGAHQRLVYAMRAAFDEDLAMILPIPTPPRAPEDALRWVDLSSCPAFFDELESLFPMPQSFGAPLARGAPAPAALAVHRVGAFDASFLPHRGELARLDPRFRLPDAVWDALARYDDWGFAVFRLRPPGEGALAPFHPMAFDFPRRDPAQLFFPTVHVHDGRVHAEAAFDHVLYAQRDDAGEVPGWWRSPGTPAGDAWQRRAFEWLDRERPVHRLELRGVYANQDVALAA